MKTAIITGVNGQDGSYLAELLLSKEYNVVGLVRRSSTDGTERIQHLLSNPRLAIIEADVTDGVCINDLVIKYKPDEFYNLAAQSHVGTSFKQPLLTWRVNAEGVFNILEAIKNYSPKTKFYQASTSEMFGKNYSRRYELKEEFRDQPFDILSVRMSNDGTMDWGSICMYDEIRYQNEETPFAPQSPYAVAKVAAHQAVGLYREAYGLHASCGILFNHESERRGEQFVTRKITRWLGRYYEWRDQSFAWNGTNPDPYTIPEDMIYHGIPERGIEYFPKLRLGNLSPRRDWGHAEDYVEAMWLMLQQNTPDDYVIATGETYSVKDFATLAFMEAGLWEQFDNLVVIDQDLVRPAEVDYLLGDATKAVNALGWKPKISFMELVSRMVESDICLAQKETNHVKSKRC